MKNKDCQKTRRHFLKLGLSSAAPLIAADSFAKTGRSETGDSIDAAADIVIIGSGPAGLSLADLLSSSGVNVIVVESGSERRSPAHQELNRVNGDRSLVKQGLGHAGVRAVGGTTHVWGGICPRFDSSDFTTHKHYQYGADWPIPFATLNRYYCKAEKWLGVSSSYCGQDGENRLNNAAQPMQAKLRQLGMTKTMQAGMSTNQRGEFRPLRLSRLVSKQLHNRKNCQIISNTAARQIDISKSGQVNGIECETINGKTRYFKCKAAVVAGGAIQNSRLLMLNTPHNFTHGLGNNSGMLAKNLMDHPNLQVWFTPQHNFLKQSDNFASYLHSYDLYQKSKEQGLGSILLRFGVFNQQLAQSQRHRALPESLGLSRDNRSSMIEALCEQEPINTNRLKLSDTQFDRFGDPLPILNFQQTDKDKKTVAHAKAKLYELASALGNNLAFRPTDLSSHHLMGTTRMASSDEHGVVDSNLKVFGTKNLYIAGASVFPSGGAANPTLSLTALSMRLAEHLLSS